MAGCKGAMVRDNTLRDGDAAFYGVDFSNEHVWRSVLVDHSRSFFYIDNAYLDATRDTYFRITKNLLQHPGTGTSNCTRFNSLNLEIKPWRTEGKHILVCEQSSSFMQMPVGYSGDWLSDLLPKLRQLTSREIRVRKWLRDKRVQQRSLVEDLVDAHAVLVWSSAAAVTAVMSGIPVIVQGQSPATLLSGSLADLENLPTPDRRNWLGVLADNQFTLEEMRNGTAWRMLNAEKR